MQRKMSGYVEIFVPAPQECMGIIIGTGGRNIKQLKHETHTRITKSSGDKFGRGSGFTVTGSAFGCESARLAIQRHIKKWKDSKVESVSPVASGSQTQSKVILAA
ncbi:RNA-binding MEX3B [Paramuricea clavata]|uniref:RNA-binding MEX3B n=1 Tax=Paramuricea clavata TaxID=317549 RepID=A0A7D9IAB5_PARCT|nr:RNA-binding MEX3B [Paramuricea clavata]